MRITNTMMMNNTLRNVGKSKSNLADLENQMSSEKKITRPSDDPIIAIRALSLRSTLNEINMYLETNVPAANAWLELTDTSLENMDSVIQDVYKYCVQGASDQFNESDRSSIIEVLKQYKNEIYSQANASNAGRYIFTGFKTDTSFTFLTDADANKKYEIEQNFTGADLIKGQLMLRSVDVPADASGLRTIGAADTPEGIDVYKYRLAYNDLESTGFATSITSYNYDDSGAISGLKFSKSVVSISEADLEAQLSAAGGYDTFAQNTTTVYYVYDTGELVIPDAQYEDFKDSKDLSFTYQKDGFLAGDPRPEMYFNCKDITDPSNVIEYNLDEDGQEISFTVNFSQTLRVNTLGSETISYDIGRDIDDMCNALLKVEEVEDTISKLEKMKESPTYSSEDAQTKLDSMIEAAKKELDYATENMKSLFSQEMTRVTAYQDKIDIQISDLGARMTRLNLTRSRLTEQKTTFTDLKSKNEDVELEDTVIKYSSASTLYEAALTAASRTVKQSLLDYI